ncbi:olfactory receptor 10AG1-like [Parambassis ranga]|uniref:Olfactory receptor n=1 Tax=Parambassis ranga TaxID=210632 RepID=A0A6P7HNX7_9TELE|nr:olfactory receptor 10AG1-like [Parambassis ranga]
MVDTLHRGVNEIHRGLFYVFLLIMFINAEINVTYITLGGHVEVNNYRYLYFIIMFTVYILIICSNATIMCLIIIHKNLHEPMYIFIAALLLNSVLLSTVIYPKLLIDFLSEKQIISYSACLFQVFLFYSLNSSEFLLLSAMAYDRYVSICKPLQYPTIMRKTTINILLVLAWLLPACQVSVPVIGRANAELCDLTLEGIFCNNSFNHLFCVSSTPFSVYGVIVLFNVVVFPVLFILFTYTKILIIAHRSCGDVRSKAAQTCLPHLLVLVNYFCLFSYDMAIVRLDTKFPKTARFVMTLQIIAYNPLCNPIIYGLKMKEISKHLKRLFGQSKQKCRH